MFNLCHTGGIFRCFPSCLCRPSIISTYLAGGGPLTGLEEPASADEVDAGRRDSASGARRQSGVVRPSCACWLHVARDCCPPPSMTYLCDLGGQTARGSRIEDCEAMRMISLLCTCAISPWKGYARTYRQA